MMENTNYSGTENLDIMKFATNYNSAIFDWITKKRISNSKIAELGAGKGEFSNRFPSLTIDVVEIDESFYPCISQNIYKSSFDLDKKYDLIYSINVIEHIEDEISIISHLTSLLNKNGTIKILVPARKELFSEMDKLVGHFRRYNKKDLIRLIESTGLTVVSCNYFDFAGYFITLIYKLFRQNGTISINSIQFYDRLIFPISRFFDRITYGKIIGKNLIIEATKD